MKEINKPKYYGSDIDEAKTDIYDTCADAFFQVYGSVPYIRTVDKNTCNIAFVIGKFRLAPRNTKRIFIPKLKFHAAVRAVRLTTALKYIYNEDRRFPVYVIHRAAKVRENSCKDNW